AEALLEEELPMRSLAGFQIALEAADVRFRERGEQNLAIAIAHSHEQFSRERRGLPQIVVPQQTDTPAGGCCRDQRDGVRAVLIAQNAKRRGARLERFTDR